MRRLHLFALLAVAALAALPRPGEYLAGVAPDREESPMRSALAQTTLEQVSATAETAPVPHSGDAADDPAIWVHPTDPARSTIIGTDKLGGLAVYDLTGKQLQYRADGNINNVDLRGGFPLGGQAVSLVAASNRSTNTIAAYRVNPATRLLEDVAARPIATGIDVYGLCMYRSPTSGKHYAVVDSKLGEVQQWELFDNGSGKVDARRVRAFDAGGAVEGCVADDELGHLYLGEETVGIWKYGAEPTAGTARTQVDKVGGGRLAGEVEGLTIARTGAGVGYLIASSQGNNTFVMYRREGSNAHVKTFQIVAGNGIDGATDTDGIDATTASLGPAFPSGVFVAQDGSNAGGNQNFKLVPWQLIAGP